MSSRVDQFETGPENLRQRGGVVPDDRQSAALLRSVEGEGADHDMASALDRLFQALDISGLIGRIGQEMKRGTVVPQIVGLGRLPGGDIGSHPSDFGRLAAKTLPGRIESGG